MGELHWKAKHKYDFGKEVDFLEAILTSNGVEDTYEFLHVSEKHTHDPFLFKNMDAALSLFHQSLHKKVYIKVDCDVDGYTSAAYIRQFIIDVAPDTEIVYGMSLNKKHGIYYDDVDGIENLALVIVPDAGSDADSVGECQKIQSLLGVPVLVLDHHQISAKIHKYAVVVNCTDGSYPNSTLSGVGVVHKFCLAYSKTYGIDPCVCNKYLDIVALGMIGDSMDMRNLETRYYTLQGLKNENRRNLFIKAIAEYCAEDMKFGHTIMSYGWTIAPKLNAIVRYGKEDEQTDLFRALCNEKEDREYQPKRASKYDPKPPVEIHSLQKTMARVCNNVKQRQDNEVRKFMKDIDTEIQRQELHKNSIIAFDGTTILTKSTVSGLVANKLASKYQRPILILKSFNQEFFGGSGRGYDKGVIKNLQEFLLKLGFFEKCSGHPNAFGLSIRKENISPLIDECNKRIKLTDLYTIHDVDYEVSSNNLTEKMVQEVANAYEIWGNHVDEPKFAIVGIRIPAQDIKGYGDNNGFIKFSYNGIDYIKKYCPKDDLDKMTLKDRGVLGVNRKQLELNIIGSFVLNSYEGRVSPQVKIWEFESKEQPPKAGKPTIDDDFIF